MFLTKQEAWSYYHAAIPLMCQCLIVFELEMMLILNLLGCLFNRYDKQEISRKVMAAYNSHNQGVVMEALVSTVTNFNDVIDYLVMHSNQHSVLFNNMSVELNRGAPTASGRHGGHLLLSLSRRLSTY